MGNNWVWGFRGYFPDTIFMFCTAPRQLRVGGREEDFAHFARGLKSAKGSKPILTQVHPQQL